MARHTRLLVISLGAAFVVTALAGCTVTSPRVITTPGPTVTVTSTPTPDSAATPLTPAEAWSVCWGFQLAEIGVDGDTSHWNKYDPKYVADDNGSYTVTIQGGAIGTNGALGCVVAGTVGQPKITDYAFTP